MKKTYKIDVDCANCANKMEEAARQTAGVKDAVVNFMTLKMTVEFEEGEKPALSTFYMVSWHQKIYWRNVNGTRHYFNILI
ncbi:MAG: hypothetical protein HFH23_09510 [Ruminococcus sp.]|nr:hypothetical protein [Ruminococcus sp.]